jgi:6-phosphogluconolactonase
VDHKGRYVLVANYGGGSTTVLPIEEYGMLGDASDFVQHKGTGGDPKRQEGPHAHCAVVDPANRFALVADLGLDKVLVYRFDETKGTLTPNDPPSVSLAPASGPRHIAFAPDGKHVYVINEMDSTVTALEYDADKGVLKKLQTLSTLPKDFKGENSTAEVVVHPSGKFLYGSDRGHNSIVIYGIEAKTGELTLIDDQVGDIKTPRNFAVDPTGKYLIVANQDGGSLFVYAIDPKTGRLTRTKQTVEVSKPVCVVFVPKAA